MVHFGNGVVLQIPGLPLIPCALRLTNYRVLFMPFQRGFAEHPQIGNYLEVPLGAIFTVKLNVIDPGHSHNVSHRRLLAQHQSRGGDDRGSASKNGSLLKRDILSPKMKEMLRNDLT